MGRILYKNYLKMGENADVKIPFLIPTQRLDAGLLKICKQYQSSYFCTVLAKIKVEKLSTEKTKV